MSVKVYSVDALSPAAKAGIRGKDVLHSIDGHELNDMLDYEFRTAKAEFQLEASREGVPYSARVSKGEYQPFGCNFETYLIDKQHSCCNKCVFCFVDQLPSGMRDTLYFKDDDERLSFLYGNYITLTNLTQKEAERIAELHISPINISVHTTNPELRVQMMKNKHAGEVLKYIDLFAKSGIEMNFQIVLCPGWNDGEQLTETLNKLTSYYPQAKSVAVVPVGVTRYRENLPQLEVYDAEGAAKVIDQIEQLSSEALANFGERIVYPSDEFFLQAGREIPPAEYYGDYPQIENGVGMWRMMKDQFEEALAIAPLRHLARKVDVAVGTGAYELLLQMATECMQRNPSVTIKVHAIENNFFGGNVCVTGLITGRDLIDQLSGKLISKNLVLPHAMLRAEGDLFLDDVSVADVKKALGVRVRVTAADGADVLKAWLKG